MDHPLLRITNRAAITMMMAPTSGAMSCMEEFYMLEQNGLLVMADEQWRVADKSAATLISTSQSGTECPEPPCYGRSSRVA